jgi:hypothetical protein
MNNEKMVTCIRCGDEDYETILRKYKSGDETLYICDRCYEREFETGL